MLQQIWPPHNRSRRFLCGWSRRVHVRCDIRHAKDRKLPVRLELQDGVVQGGPQVPSSLVGDDDDADGVLFLLCDPCCSCEVCSCSPFLRPFFPFSPFLFSFFLVGFPLSLGQTQLTVLFLSPDSSAPSTQEASETTAPTAVFAPSNAATSTSMAVLRPVPVARSRTKNGTR